MRKHPCGLLAPGLGLLASVVSGCSSPEDPSHADSSGGASGAGATSAENGAQSPGGRASSGGATSGSGNGAGAWIGTGGSATGGNGSGGAPAGSSGGLGTAGNGKGGAGTGTGGAAGSGNVGGGSDGWVDRCPPYPAFPDADCTGPTSDNLPLYTGSLEFRTDGEVIENVEMRIDDGLYVPASNVTFRNVKIVFTAPLDRTFTMANLNNNAGTVFQDCELDGQGNVARAVSGNGVTVRNCEIHHVGNAVETASPMVIEGNYIHDIYETEGTDWHADGIQTPKSDDHILVRHNTILMRDPSTAAINVMGSDDDPATDVLIEHNLMAGAGYTIYAGPGTNYRVVENHLSTQFFPKVGFYNIWYWGTDEDGDVERTGNVIHETGANANDNL